MFEWKWEDEDGTEYTFQLEYTLYPPDPASGVFRPWADFSLVDVDPPLPLVTAIAILDDNYETIQELITGA